MSAHTPGPWFWVEDNSADNGTLPVLMSAAGAVCDFGDCETYYPTAGDPPKESDARLIAAAPCLLEALQKALNVLDATGARYEANTARAAIDKAVKP
jgi:hypothetical protein